MIIIILKMIFRRFAELVFLTSGISVTLTVLNIMEVLNVKNTLAVGMFAGAALFAVLNFISLRQSFFELRDTYIYYISNILAYIAFVIFGYVVYTNYPTEIYTWFLAVTKFAKYTNIGITNFYSAVIFYLIGFILIFIAPIGMWRIFFYDNPDEEEEEGYFEDETE